MAQVMLKKTCIVVTAQNKQEVLQCASIGDAKWIEGSTYEFPHESIMQVLSAFFHINSILEIKYAIKQGVLPQGALTLAQRCISVTDKIDVLKTSGPHMEHAGFLFRHQQLCREIALVAPRYGFFCETGTGKTPIALTIINDDILLNKEPNKTRRWLVVCPLSLIQPAWMNDAEKFYPHLRVVRLHQSTPARTREAFKADADIYIINFEGFKSKYEEIEKMGFVGCIIDESSKMKNHTSQITKQLLKFSEKVYKWYELSGTPAPNNMLEYFAQMKAIDPTVLGHSFTAFKQRWFYSYSKGFAQAYEITDESKAAMTEQLEKKAIFIAKEDCLDLPEQMFVDRQCYLPKDLKDKYETMKQELYARIEEEVAAGKTERMVFATTAVTALGKLNQLTSGIIIDEDGTVHRVSNYKMDLLMEELELIGPKQVIIWANYRGEFEWIKEKLGDTCITYYGGTTTQEVKDLVVKHYSAEAFDYWLNEGLTIKDMAVRLFQQGKVQYLVANPKSAAHGLTLTNASYTIWYSLNYSYEAWKQANDRTHRFGQKEKCTYISLLTQGTVDYAIYKALKDKGDLSVEVLNHLKPQAIGGK